MKKAVITIVAIIYVAAILFVGFYGVNATFANVTVYVEKIECINEDRFDAVGNQIVKIVHDEENNTTKIQILDLEQIYYEEGASYKIDWKVYPEDATDKNVEFKYEENSRFYIEGDGLGQIPGTVHFTLSEEDLAKKRITFNTITLQSVDGFKAKTYIEISCMIKSNF
ncbi:MAG: hypothetical protein LBM03_01265 [Erysipelotrichaceae bacterium]|jgi:hypothetical protein|nr:hypothetical protein [Erysipelotrichaceae bacterium]